MYELIIAMMYDKRAGTYPEQEHTRLKAQSLQEVDSNLFIEGVVFPNVRIGAEIERNVNPCTYPHVFGMMFG